ncbi:hypothetical protein GE21DRAFT_1350380, partial [Neurospora crassa]
MATRLPALASLPTCPKEKEKNSFALSQPTHSRSWRPYFRAEGTQSYLTEATQHMASSGRVAWPDCKGLTAASEGQRTMVGYVAGVRANLETRPMEGQGGAGSRCQSLAGDHGVQPS